MAIIVLKYFAMIWLDGYCREKYAILDGGNGLCRARWHRHGVGSGAVASAEATRGTVNGGCESVHLRQDQDLDAGTMGGCEETMVTKSENVFGLPGQLAGGNGKAEALTK